MAAPKDNFRRNVMRCVLSWTIFLTPRYTQRYTPAGAGLRFSFVKKKFYLISNIPKQCRQFKYHLKIINVHFPYMILPFQMFAVILLMYPSHTSVGIQPNYCKLRN